MQYKKTGIVWQDKQHVKISERWKQWRLKVRFQEDVVESSLRKLRRRQYDLLQRLESIVLEFWKENEEFDYLLKTAEAHNY